MPYYVKIDVSNTGRENHAGKAALSVQGKGNVEIELDGENELKSGAYRAGLEKNNSTSAGTLTLKDNKEAGSGSLNAEGGALSAGIGGGDGGGAENITITGSTVTATGGSAMGFGGAGIGGGSDGRNSDSNGKNITITGSTVIATSEGVGERGNRGGAGIGGGCIGNGENIAITGSTVTATGHFGGAGIGGGYKGSGSNVTVSGAAQVTAIAFAGDRWDGVGATIGSGSSGSKRNPDGTFTTVSGKEIQADISGLTTGYIHHMIHNEDESLEREWWEPEHPQPTPEGPNAPAEESNEVSLGTPGLHVETLEGSPLPFNARRQGSTLRVTSDTLAARLHGTRPNRSVSASFPSIW